ncbi:hypothetical protein [Enterovibrio norvegicus]|nr:hypothetical protein [Enterovibrio norvegicus]OEF55833.1 hypothetical protein A1OU_13675 [Enterovibrio norvegicus]
MNRKSLAATIGSKHSGRLTSGRNSDGSAIKYLTLFKDPGGNGAFGITEFGDWCSIGTEVRTVSEVDHERIFFRLLENPLNEVVSLIKSSLKELHLPEIIVLTFPFDSILVAALQSSWKDLAMKWIDSGYPLNDEMILILSGNDKQSKFWLKK